MCIVLLFQKSGLMIPKLHSVHSRLEQMSKYAEENGSQVSQCWGTDLKIKGGKE